MRDPDVAAREISASDAAACESFSREGPPFTLVPEDQSMARRNRNKAALPGGAVFEAAFVAIAAIAVLLTGIVFLFELLR
jgi:hypothetical protein